MSNIVGTTITSEFVNQFDAGDNASLGNSRPNATAFGLYNAGNEQIIIGPQPSDTNASALSSPTIFQFQKERIGSTSDIEYAIGIVDGRTYDGNIYRQFEDQSVIFSEIASNPLHYLNHLLHVGDEWMLIVGAGTLNVGGQNTSGYNFGGFGVLNPVNETILTPMITLNLERGVLGSAPTAHGPGETVELWIPFEHWTQEEIEEIVQEQYGESVFIDEINVNFGVPNVTINPTLSRFFDPYRGIDITPPFFSECISDSIEVEGVFNETRFNVGINTDNRVYLTHDEPALFINEDGSLSNDIVIHKITLSGDFNNTDESLSLQIGGPGTLELTEFNEPALSTGFSDSEPRVVFGPELGDENFPISLISDTSSPDYGKVFISVDVRSAVGGNEGQGDFDAFLSITFLNTSFATTPTYLSLNNNAFGDGWNGQFGNTMVYTYGLPLYQYSCGTDPSIGPYLEIGTIIGTAPQDRIFEKRNWRVSCTQFDGSISEPIPWVEGTPQDACYDAFSLPFNSDRYWLSDRDKRPALGCFNTLEQNVAKNNFESSVIEDEKFVQSFKHNLVGNGNGRIVLHPPGSYYPNNPSFGDNAYLPYGGWDYLKLDGIGYKLSYAFVDESLNGINPPPLPSAWEGLENSFIQSTNYGNYYATQESDAIYGYAGYYPYPYTNLNQNYQWASWQQSEECYSYGRCLRFKADPDFWIDPTEPPPDGVGSESWIEDPVMGLINRNQYRTINQYQKIYDHETGEITPYSSLEVSFWMKTMDDGYNPNKKPAVEAGIMAKKNPGQIDSFTEVYTELGYRLATGLITEEDVAAGIEYIQTFTNPNPWNIEIITGDVESDIGGIPPSSFAPFLLLGQGGTPLTDTTWWNGDSPIPGSPGAETQPPKFYFDEPTLTKFCQLVMPEEQYGVVRARMEGENASTSIEFNIFDYSEIPITDSIYLTNWMKYSVPRFDLQNGYWKFYSEFQDYYDSQVSQFGDAYVQQYSMDDIYNSQNSSIVEVAQTITCEKVGSAALELANSNTIDYDIIRDDIGLHNAENTTIITTINQNLLVEEYPTINIGDVSFNLQNDNYEIFENINEVFNLTELPPEGVLDTYTFVQNTNANNGREVLIQNYNFFLDYTQQQPGDELFDIPVEENIILTKMRLSGDFGASDEYCRWRMGKKVGYNMGAEGDWDLNDNRVGNNPGIEGTPVITYFNARAESPVYDGRSGKMVGPLPISVYNDSDDDRYGQIICHQNLTSDVERNISINATEMTLELTFEKYEPQSYNDYYIRIGELWDYEWIKITNTNFLSSGNEQDTNFPGIILSTETGYNGQGSTHYMGGTIGNFAGILELTVERGLLGTTARAHGPNEPVKIYKGYPPELGNETGAASSIEIFQNFNSLTQVGKYNSLTTTNNTNNSYNLGSMGRFQNNVPGKWEHKTFTFNLTSEHLVALNHTQVSDLYFVIQAGNDFEGTVYIDDMEVKESYEFRPDCDVRKKISAGVYGIGDLTQYYDPTIPEQFDAFNDTTAPLEVQFYFYARHKVEEFLNLSNPSFPIYNDFRNGMFYLHNLDWGDESPLEYVSEPLQLGDDIAVYHTYETSGIYEVKGVMIRMKPNLENIESTVAHTQGFTLRININEDLDEDFEFFGSDGFSFIPFKNTTPTVGGYSEQSIYYKSTRRQLGIITDEINLDTKFKKVSDKLKTQIALDKMDSSYSNGFEILNAFKQVRYSDEIRTDDGAGGDIVYNGFTTLEEELGKSIGDTDVTTIRYFNKPMQIWEMLGFEDEDDPAQGHPGNPSSPRYWKKIIPKDYSIFERDGINPSTGLLRLNIEQANHEQNWRLAGLYRYPVLPKYGADGKFIEGVYPGGFEPFPLTGPITDENYMDENLKISITTKDVELNVLDDNSGNNNYGFTYGDYRPNFDSQTLEPKKVKTSTPIKTSKTRGAF